MKILSIGEMRINAINARYASIDRTHRCDTVHIQAIEEPRELATRSLRDCIVESRNVRIGMRSMKLKSTKSALEIIMGKQSAASLKMAKYLLKILEIEAKITRIESTRVDLSALRGIEFLTACRAHRARIGHVKRLRESLTEAIILREGYGLDATRLQNELTEYCATHGVKNAMVRVGKGRRNKVQNRAVRQWQEQRISLLSMAEIAEYKHALELKGLAANI